MIQTAGAYTPEMFHGCRRNLLDPMAWLFWDAEYGVIRGVTLYETPKSPSIHARALMYNTPMSTSTPSRRTVGPGRRMAGVTT